MTDKETLKKNTETYYHLMEWLLRDEYSEWKKKYHGAYGVRCAYWAPSKYHMTDPMVYCKGYAAYDCDVYDWIYEDIKDSKGREEAERAANNPSVWNEYLGFFQADIPYIIQECGVKMTLKQFYNKYVK